MRVLALAALACLTVSAGSARALVATGMLQCTISAGSVVVGAYRNVICMYDRPNLPSERYEGFTGVITSGTFGEQVVTYDVSLPDPEALAALGGDYDQNLFGSPAITRPAVNSLLGGRRRQVILQPIENGSTTNLAVLNYFIGVTQLHLNYAGTPSHRIGARRHTRAEAP